MWENVTISNSTISNNHTGGAAALTMTGAPGTILSDDAIYGNEQVLLRRFGSVTPLGQSRTRLSRAITAPVRLRDYCLARARSLFEFRRTFYVPE